MRKASRIYKRKNRSNLETLIILVGAIIMLSVAFYLDRDRSYIPPKTQTIKEEESIETSVAESPQEIPQKTATTKKKEQVKITETKIKEEIIPEEKASSAEPAAIVTPKKELETNVAKQSKTGTEKKVYTMGRDKERVPTIDFKALI